jgi:hypothetical protein
VVCNPVIFETVLLNINNSIPGRRLGVYPAFGGFSSDFVRASQVTRWPARGGVLSEDVHTLNTFQFVSFYM